MNKGIAIAGNLLVDIIKTIDVFPDRGMLEQYRARGTLCGRLRRKYSG